jgi:phospholipid/cholesterol/gamma-HCH transport system substrate-binding protein
MEQRKATFVGVISFIMLILIGSLILWKSDLRFRANGYKLVCSFEHVGGLSKGSEVRYRGYGVGRVSSVFPQPSDIKVEIWIKNAVPVTKGSSVRVLFDGLVGENYVAIVPNELENDLMQHGDIIYGSSGSDLAEFIDLGSQNMVHAEVILNSLRGLFTDKKTLRNVQSILSNAASLTSEILTISQNLNKHTDFSKLSTIINELYSTTVLVKDSSEDLLGDGKIVSDFRNFSSQLSLMSQTLNKTSEGVHSAVDQDVIIQFKETIKNLNAITESLKMLLNGESDDSTKKPFKIGGVFNLLTSVDFNTEAEFRYGAADETSNYEASIDMSSGKHFIRTSIGGSSNGESKLQNIQHGINLTDSLTSRVGYFYETPGIGIDYKISDKLGLSLSTYDIGNTKVDIYANYEVLNDVDLLYGIRNNVDNNKLNTIDMGTKFKF